jgi:biotin carboxylase
MKEVIILQNSKAFTVDINQLFAPQERNLYLIINPASFNKLQGRHQDKLFVQIDIIDDFDFKNVSVIVEKIIRGKSLNNVSIVTNSEWCVALCGRLRQYFGVKGLNEQTALQFTNKIAMKQALKSSGIRMPIHLLFDEKQCAEDSASYINKVMAKLGPTIFAKPLDDASSQFTCKIQSPEEFFNWFQRKEKNKIFELDEYVIGKVYHIDSIVKNGKILAAYVGEYSHPPFEFLIGKTLGSIILPADHPDVESMLVLNQKILKTLIYNDSGITHLEVIKSKSNELIFLEIAARAGGAWLPKLYKKHLGLSLFETSLLAQISPQFTLNTHKGPYAAALGYPFLEGKIDRIKLSNLYGNFILECNIRPV